MPRAATKIRRELGQIWRELSGAVRISGSARDLGRYAADAILYRVRHVLRLRDRGGEKTITVRDGARITYRSERGDVWVLSEVWMDEVYTLPPGCQPDVVVDLGAHIGLTSLWFAKHYKPRTLISVEASPDNVALARRNLVQNGIQADVIHAAVSDRDGVGRFHVPRHSASGRLSAQGDEVALMSMASIFARIPAEKPVDVVKIDIEGGEGALFSGDLTWLNRVGMLLLETHPSVPAEPILGKLFSAGFREIGSGRASDHTRCFARHDHGGRRARGTPPKRDARGLPPRHGLGGWERDRLRALVEGANWQEMGMTSSPAWSVRRREPRGLAADSAA